MRSPSPGPHGAGRLPRPAAPFAWLSALLALGAASPLACSSAATDPPVAASPGGAAGGGAGPGGSASGGAGAGAAGGRAAGGASGAGGQASGGKGGTGAAGAGHAGAPGSAGASGKASGGGSGASAGGGSGGASGGGGSGSGGASGGGAAGGPGGAGGAGGCPAAPVCALSPAVGDAPPLLFHVSPTGRAGDVLGVQGARFTAAAQVSLETLGSDAPPRMLQVVAGSAGHLAPLLPADLAPGIYAIRVAEGGQQSAPARVNAPRIDQVEHDELAPGSPFRVFGRNLGGMSGRITLVGPGGERLAAPVLSGDEYMLAATAPAALAAGTHYQVAIDSGLGCGCGETLSDETVVGRAGGADPFGLGAPWGADFTFAGNVYDVSSDARLGLHAKGDGQADDTAALQQALDRASKDGGGVVFLPAGTYRLGGAAGLHLASNVVLKGAGQGQTTVQYGFVAPAPSEWGIVFYQDGGGSLGGLASLRLQNVDPGGQWGRNLNVPGSWSRLFFKDVGFDLGGGGPLWVGAVPHLLIADCAVSSVQSSLASGDNGNSGTFIVSGSHFWLRNTTTSWNVAAVAFNDLDHAVIEASTFVRDGAKHTVENTRGVNLNFARRLAMIGNHMKVTGKDNLALNDGETILTEGGGPYRRDEDVCVATSATATTLTDASKAWMPLQADAVAVVVGGAASGQWRRVVSRTPTTLTVDPPWDLVPEPGAHVAITNWGAERWLIKDNDLTGCARGIMLYGASANAVAIVGNTLTDSSGIWLQPFQVFTPQRSTLTPLFDVLVEGNSAVDTAALTGSFIALDVAVNSPGTENIFGTTAFGVELRGNTVTGLTPNTPTVPGYHPYREGFTAQAFFETPPGPFEGHPPAVLGAIFQGNHAENSDVAFTVGTGDLDTVLWQNTAVGAAKVVSDDKIQGASQASVGTVTGP